MKEKVDHLVKILRGIKSKAKKAHLCFNLAFQNLSLVATNMIIVDHVKSDLKCLDEYESLVSLY
jgi:hypothetical protein